MYSYIWDSLQKVQKKQIKNDKNIKMELINTNNNELNVEQEMLKLYETQCNKKIKNFIFFLQIQILIFKGTVQTFWLGSI